MPDTYTQLNIMMVFAVGERASLLNPNWSSRLYDFFGGILKDLDCYPLKIGGWLDHVHLFFELSPGRSVSEIARHVKSRSSAWLNESQMIDGHFCWQEGYGAFSYSRSQRKNVIDYIENQAQHHTGVSFRDELGY